MSIVCVCVCVCVCVGRIQVPSQFSLNSCSVVHLVHFERFNLFFKMYRMLLLYGKSNNSEVRRPVHWCGCVPF